MIDLKNLAKYRRYIENNLGLLIVKGGIEPVMAGMREYNTRYKIAHPDPVLEPALREILAAVGLAAVSLADRESWGWSMTFAGKKIGFFAGAEPEGMLCLRVRQADEDRSILLVQRQKPTQRLTQSHIEPKGDIFSKIVQQYFEEAEQTHTQLAIRSDGQGVLIRAFPGADLGTVSCLSDDELFDFAEKLIESNICKNAGEVLLFYECRCNERIISDMIGNMQKAAREELFGDSLKIEIECPRCGRVYTVKRNEIVH